MPDVDLRGLLLAFVAAAAVAMLPRLASAAPPTPVPQSPPAGATVPAIGAMSWKPARGAVSYEFQLAADRAFGSIVAGSGPGKGRQVTHNLAATLDAQPPDGTYHWRVRALDLAGHAGRWSTARTLVKAWSDGPRLVGPLDALQVAWPREPLVLRWTSAPLATSYRVTIATDPQLANPIGGRAANPVETQGTRFALPDALAPGTYYWAVTPLDADGHSGARSAVGSFTWTWPDEPMGRTVSHDPARLDHADVELSWGRVIGAARYEVEVNTSRDFTPGSKWCCDTPVIGTAVAMRKRLANNDYYWRVRAIDPRGNAGRWYEGPRIHTQFPPVTNVRLQDAAGTALAAGASTASPVVRWDPVPGAGSYEVRGAPYHDGLCDYTSGRAFDDYTATPAWTPLAKKTTTTEPGPAAWPRTTYEEVKVDWTTLPYEDWCVRVLARADRDARGNEVVGPWTSVGDLDAPAFRWQAPAAPGTPRSPFRALAGDLLTPAAGATTTDQPLFTWQPIPGAASYYVVVSRDADFTNVVDVALTNIPAYAPRRAVTQVPISYADESADERLPYWWMVIPAQSPGGSGLGSLNVAQAPQFTYDSPRPTPATPADGEVVPLQPTLRWSAVPGARSYRVQIAADPSFGAPLDDISTDASSYTTDSTLPADALLYWRVRATGESGVGLNWSPTSSFVRRLPGTQAGEDASTGGPLFPILRWDPVPGATAYDIHVEEADGDSVDATTASTAATPVVFEGTGIWTWRVRPRFPGLRADVPGPWSPSQPFVRHLGAPAGVTASRSSAGTLLQWSPDPAATTYSVDVAPTNGFTRILEHAFVSSSVWAPQLTAPAMRAGGRFFWRVASRDHGRTVGAYASGSFSLPRPLRVATRGTLRRGRVARLTISVARGDGRPASGVVVRVRGKGLRTLRRKVDKRGGVRLTLRPRTRTRLTVSATKKGYQEGLATVRVR